ncbi:MAG: hypothetical protein HOP02_16315 [Methylococcaceae bacterium]|nr:hypothetical protein [Methylococcaceae bacterium]
MKKPPQATTLLDRIAVAWLSGVAAAITGGLIILALSKVLPNSVKLADISDFYLGFIVIMTILGFCC